MENEDIKTILEIALKAKQYQKEIDSATRHQIILDFWLKNRLLRKYSFPTKINIFGSRYSECLIIERIEIILLNGNLPDNLQFELKDVIEMSYEIQGVSWNITQDEVASNDFKTEWFTQLQ
jgi:hypothetical protein